MHGHIKLFNTPVLIVNGTKHKKSIEIIVRSYKKKISAQTCSEATLVLN